MAMIALLMLAAASCGSHHTTTRKGSAAAAAARAHFPAKAPATVVTGRGHNDNDARMAKDLLAEAWEWLGTPYRYGACTRSGTDCSGFVMSVFAAAASVKLPRDSRSQQSYCSPVATKSLQPGDLVFFAGTKGGGVSHVGLYAGDGNFIHASTSRGVIVSSLEEDYYTRHFHSAGRVKDITYAATGRRPAKSKAPEPEEPMVAAATEQASAEEAIAAELSVRKNLHTKAPKQPRTTRGTKKQAKASAPNAAMTISAEALSQAAAPPSQPETVDSVMTAWME